MRMSFDNSGDNSTIRLHVLNMTLIDCSLVTAHETISAEGSSKDSSASQ